jgi:hypothetical protein
VEAKLTVEDIPVDFTSTTSIVPDDITTTYLKDEVFRKLGEASQTTLEFHGNSSTITGTHHNVEHTKIMVYVINRLQPQPSRSKSDFEIC